MHRRTVRGIGDVRVQMATRAREQGGGREDGKERGEKRNGGEESERGAGERRRGAARQTEIGRKEREGKRKTGSLVAVHRMRPVYVRSFALQT